MKPPLAALLASSGTDPAARQELRRRRLETISAAERMEVARRLLERNDARTAALWLFRARREDPDDATVAYQLANALRIAGRERAARTLLESLCRRFPAWAEPAYSLAWLDRRAHRAQLAADTLACWTVAMNYDAKALRSAVAFCREMGIDERAEALLAQAPALRETPELLLERGRLLLALGRFAQAEELLRELLRFAPDNAEAAFRLAYTRRWSDERESPLALLGAALARAPAVSAARAALLFAIAKVEDDLGHYAKAWGAAERANALRAAGASFVRGDLNAYERALREVFTPEFFSRLAGAAGSREQPVFVVGMPRSGTTLVERHLAVHPALHAAGELELIEALGRELAGVQGYPRGLAGIGASALAAAAAEWRRRLPAAIAPDATVVDKNPLNFAHLGLIAAMFPLARIVYCRRDPLDIALSIYFQNFAHPRNDYAYRIEDIAAMTGFHRRIMAYWERVLPTPIFPIDYERFVAEPEAQRRSVIGWLGLSWDAAIVTDAAAGAIHTASQWQARQPVYRHALGRARHYAPWIGPLSDALRSEELADTESAPRGSPE